MTESKVHIEMFTNGIYNHYEKMNESFNCRFLKWVDQPTAVHWHKNCTPTLHLFLNCSSVSYPFYNFMMRIKPYFRISRYNVYFSVVIFSKTTCFKGMVNYKNSMYFEWCFFVMENASGCIQSLSAYSQPCFLNYFHIIFYIKRVFSLFF